MLRNKAKIIAIILILAFIQKLGLGLFMHVWFHEKNTGLVLHLPSRSPHLEQIKCTCIEDAMMPLAAGAASLEIKPLVSYFFSYNDPHPSFYSFVRKIFYSLRGPPQIIPHQANAWNL